MTIQSAVPPSIARVKAFVAAQYGVSDALLTSATRRRGQKASSALSPARMRLSAC